MAVGRGCRLDRAGPALDGRSPPGRDLPRRVRAAVRAAGRRLRPAALQPSSLARPLRRPRRDRAPLCRCRALPVGDPRGLLEPEAAGRQRLRALLPRQLGLLGPVDLRPLPRRRDPRDAGARPPRLAEQAPRRRDRRDRRDLGRPPVLVLTVELRRADRGHARGRRPDLALACRGGARSARRGARLGRLRHAAGAPRAAAGVAAGSQLGHERPGRARRQRAQDRRRPSGPRRRHRQLQARVRREDRAEGGGAEEGRLALDAGDRGRRDGRAGARAALLARLRRAGDGLSQPRQVGCGTRGTRRGAYAWRDRRAQPLLQRALRGSDHVGAARPDRARQPPTGRRSPSPRDRDLEARARARAAHRRR